jgi:hypothetical protein
MNSPSSSNGQSEMREMGGVSPYVSTLVGPGRRAEEALPELLSAQQLSGMPRSVQLEPRYSSTCLEVLFVCYALAVLWVSMTLRADSDMPPGLEVLIYMAVAASPLALVGLLATVTKVAVWLRVRRRTTVP